MNAIDNEWNEMMADWQVEETAPSDDTRKKIRQRVQRQGIRMILVALFEVIGSAAMLAWVWQESMDEPREIAIVGIAGTAVLIAVALGFSLWNRRGIWTPATESTMTYIELSLKRQRRKLDALRFCPWFLALELAFLIPWSLWALLSEPSPLLKWFFAFGWMAGMSALLLVFWSWYRRKTLRKIAEWEELRRALSLE